MNHVVTMQMKQSEVHPSSMGPISIDVVDLDPIIPLEKQSTEATPSALCAQQASSKRGQIPIVL
jgi:hypothetical protein